ncbi:MAG: adenine phosphoribosyltransferase [Rhizobiales bacterium]|nr:adenine phosphoribosyltransferase [Hyphomicrobiales bacterium]
MDLKAHIRTIPDFPKPGILFYDITTLLMNGEAFQHALDQLHAVVEETGPDHIVAIESRGFLFGAPLAALSRIGLVLVRKQGKLPGAVIGHTYDLEYGTDTIEISEGFIQPGNQVLIVDDLLATGGTALATRTLLESIGAHVVGTLCLIELLGLGGRAKVGGEVWSVLTYDV